MPDYLHPRLEDAALGQLSALGLAHIGDGVYELMTRGSLVTGGLLTAHHLHAQTVRLVCAAAQYRAAQAILPLLDEEEEAVFRHGRNAKPKTIPKSASQAEYAYATALEALFGWLLLKGRYERLNELYEVISRDREQAGPAN